MHAACKLQLWLWFVGMLVLTLPWHLVGLLGMPRRMAYYDYSDPALAPQAWTVVASTFGGLLLVSGVLFIVVLARAHARAAPAAAATPSAPVHEGCARRAAERLRAVGGDDDRAHGRELRLADRAARLAEDGVGADHPHRDAMMSGLPLDLAQPVVPMERHLARGARRGDARRLRVAADGAGRLHRAGAVGEHLPGGRRPREWGDAKEATRPGGVDGGRARSADGACARPTRSAAARRSH